MKWRDLLLRGVTPKMVDLANQEIEYPGLKITIGGEEVPLSYFAPEERKRILDSVKGKAV